jgi:cell division protein FtsB
MATTRRPGGTAKAPRRTTSARVGSSSSERGSATRPGTRPAAAARGRRPPQEQRTPRSIKGMAIVASIFLILAITLIPALRATYTQQAQISGLRDRIAEQRERVATLQQEERNWTDPAYVEQQARERLKFVRVGEKSFTVIDGDAAPDLSGGAQMASPERVSTVSTPWYGELWQSMVIADTRARVASERPPSAPSAR